MAWGDASWLARHDRSQLQCGLMRDERRVEDTTGEAVADQQNSVLCIA